MNLGISRFPLGLTLSLLCLQGCGSSDAGTLLPGSGSADENVRSGSGAATGSTPTPNKSAGDEGTARANDAGPSVEDAGTRAPDAQTAATEESKWLNAHQTPEYDPASTSGGKVSQDCLTCHGGQGQGSMGFGVTTRFDFAGRTTPYAKVKVEGANGVAGVLIANSTGVFYWPPVQPLRSVGTGTGTNEASNYPTITFPATAEVRRSDGTTVAMESTLTGGACMSCHGVSAAAIR